MLDFKKEYKDLYQPSTEPSIVTVPKMHEFAEAEGYKLDFGERLHHEIYLSDPRRCDPSKLKTVIRHPVAKK